MEELNYTQKKEISFIAVRGSVASCDFNTKINSAIKRNKIYEDDYSLKVLNEYITSFKTHLFEYLGLLEYRVLEISYEMCSIDSLVNDMNNIENLVNDELYNFVSLLVSFVDKILRIRNSIVSLGCDEESCLKSLNKMISLLGVNHKYVR